LRDAMRKSPWVILVIGVMGIVSIGIMGNYYLRNNPMVRLKAELVQEYGIDDVVVKKDEETGMLTIVYKPDPIAFREKRVLEKQMGDIARHARVKHSYTDVTVVARLSEEKSQTMVFKAD